MGPNGPLTRRSCCGPEYPLKSSQSDWDKAAQQTMMDIYAHLLSGDDTEAADLFAAVADPNVANMLPAARFAVLIHALEEWPSGRRHLS